jgi:hypothetical protein
MPFDEIVKRGGAAVSRYEENFVPRGRAGISPALIPLRILPTTSAAPPAPVV